MLEGSEAETYRSVVGILMYFKRLELVRPREPLTELVGWCDGSWAVLDEKRRSTTGGLLMLGACVAGWSRTQKPTALSSGESEFYSATVCTYKPL